MLFPLHWKWRECQVKLFFVAVYFFVVHNYYWIAMLNIVRNRTAVTISAAYSAFSKTVTAVLTENKIELFSDKASANQLSHARCYTYIIFPLSTTHTDS